MHRQKIAAIHKQLHGYTGGPRRPGQSFAIEHREQQKKSEVRPFLGEGVVEDPKQFVPFVLVFSGGLGREATAFLEHLRSICSFWYYNDYLHITADGGGGAGGLRFLCTPLLWVHTHFVGTWTCPYLGRIFRTNYLKKCRFVLTDNIYTNNILWSVLVEWFMP